MDHSCGLSRQASHSSGQPTAGLRGRGTKDEQRPRAACNPFYLNAGEAEAAPGRAKGWKSEKAAKRRLEITEAWLSGRYHSARALAIDKGVDPSLVQKIVKGLKQ